MDKIHTHTHTHTVHVRSHTQMCLKETRRAEAPEKVRPVGHITHLFRSSWIEAIGRWQQAIGNHEKQATVEIPS